MSGTGALVTLSPRDWDAVLFDMDGVLTRTAEVHARPWKKLFDEFLEGHSKRTGAPFVPFDIEVDYRRYVDGKPRYDGVTSLLTSRGIELPFEPRLMAGLIASSCADGRLKNIRAESRRRGPSADPRNAQRVGLAYR